MKAKLIKTDKNNYILVDPTKGVYDKGYLIGSSIETDSYKLSKEKCDELFGVVNVEMLACEEIRIHIDAYQDIHTESTKKNASPCTPLNEGGCVGANLYSQVNGFIKGFNKAMDFNKDKEFTLEDMKNAISKSWYAAVKSHHNFNGRTYITDDDVNEIIQPFQQPTEMDVEIIYERDCYSSKGRCDKTTMSQCIICTPVYPLEDENGNLILKKL